ncbi:hypothetical protein AVEN_27107-1 [Araneus ventricosus]|uniref:Uncharacterized protein n=1 Tax=Araneus ventricosus TaxID=182803 RepID=A0A4Y2T1T2_ARAVE|nr:hypothetical protein AVEN_211226-1 [Araneus ventricosus]GBN93835.1 hypothetical protein AVEN_222132-1 [Araneus ventricosus]GBN94468.1 hypothetical protein AVEN_27107-1 [Araneus ventricosus]
MSAGGLTDIHEFHKGTLRAERYWGLILKRDIHHYSTPPFLEHCRPKPFINGNPLYPPSEVGKGCLGVPRHPFSFSFSKERMSSEFGK